MRRSGIREPCAPQADAKGIEILMVAGSCQSEVVSFDDGVPFPGSVVTSLTSPGALACHIRLRPWCTWTGRAA